MSTHTDLPRPIRLTILVISLAVFLSALAGAGVAVLLPLVVEGQRTALALFGFEIVVAIAAILGLFIGFSRSCNFGNAPGMALLCVGGTIFAGSVLGWQGAGRQLAGTSLTPFMGLRVLAGFAILGLAGAVVLGRSQQGAKVWRPAIIGCLLGLPVLVAAGAMVHPRTRGMLTGIGGSSGDDVLFQAGAALLAMIVFGGLLAASVHLVIGAFDRAIGD